MPGSLLGPRSVCAPSSSPAWLRMACGSARESRPPRSETTALGAIETAPARETVRRGCIRGRDAVCARGHENRAGIGPLQRLGDGPPGGGPPCGGSAVATAPSWVQRSANTTPPSGVYPLARQPAPGRGGPEYALVGAEP